MRHGDEGARALLAALASCELPSLDHEQHVQVAWHLLRESSLAETLRVLPPLLLAYATSKGHPEIYHETITFAFVCIVHERLATGGRGQDWGSFSAQHPDLFDRRLLSRYYPSGVLQSSRARQTFVLPCRSVAQD